jgi:hypothetical protein
MRTHATIPAALQARGAPFSARQPRKARCTRDFSYLGLQRGELRVSRVVIGGSKNCTNAVVTCAAWTLCLELQLCQTRLLTQIYKEMLTRKVVRLWRRRGGTDDFALGSRSLR